jgi:hypothetical protein
VEQTKSLYHNPAVVKQVIAGIDHHAIRLHEDAKASLAGSGGNSAWGGAHGQIG